MKVPELHITGGRFFFQAAPHSGEGTLLVLTPEMEVKSFPIGGFLKMTANGIQPSEELANLLTPGELVVTSDDHAVTSAEGIIVVKDMEADVQIDLLSVNEATRNIVISKIDSDDYVVNIVPYSGETINGNTSYVLRGQKQLVCLIKDTANSDWKIISSRTSKPTFIVNISVPYEIKQGGVYKIVTGGDLISFADPSTYNGEEVVIVNDCGVDVSIDNTNTFSPYESGTLTQLSIIKDKYAYVFNSIDSLLYGGAL